MSNSPFITPSGYTTMTVTPHDVLALQPLFDASAHDRSRLGSLGSRLQSRSARVLALLDPGGRPVAFAAVDVHSVPQEHRAYLDGFVDPSLPDPDPGARLLGWADSTARDMLTTLSDDRPRFLLIEVFGETAGTAIYRDHGFDLRLAEETMMRDLDAALPTVPAVPGLHLEPWTAGGAADFYAVYVDAFHDRPGFPGYSQQVWTAVFTGHDEFRADLSRLARLDGRPAGYLLAAVDDEENANLERTVAWVVQMGVRPALRGRSLGATLLADALQRFAATGLARAALDVNLNNPGARRLYERLGFRRSELRTVYAKPVASAGEETRPDR